MRLGSTCNDECPPHDNDEDELADDMDAIDDLEPELEESMTQAATGKIKRMNMRRKDAKRGPGRPKLGPDEKRVPIQFNAKPDDAEKLKKEAEAAGVSISELVCKKLGLS